jgi:hypothetical protein
MESKRRGKLQRPSMGKAAISDAVINAAKSELGQKRHLDRRSATSGLPREADIFRVIRHVSKMPCAVVEDRGTSPNEISSTSTPIRVLLGGVFRMT